MLELLQRGRLNVIITEVIDPASTFQRVSDDNAYRVIEIDGSRDGIHFLYSRKTVPAETVARIDMAIKAFVDTAPYKALFAKYLRR